MIEKIVSSWRNCFKRQLACCTFICTHILEFSWSGIEFPLCTYWAFVASCDLVLLLLMCVHINVLRADFRNILTPACCTKLLTGGANWRPFYHLWDALNYTKLTKAKLNLNNICFPRQIISQLLTIEPGDGKNCHGKLLLKIIGK